MLPRQFGYNATVLYVHDGDTFDVDIDWGMRRHDTNQPVRLIGFAANELSAPGGKEAAKNLAAILLPGTRVYLETVKPDKYAPRFDAQVTIMWGGQEVNLGELLLQQGWVVRWDGRGPQPTVPFPPVPQPLPGATA